jgi:2C-methyl-D-erythritol 2,4-cyclodiphosphate synthase
MTNTKQSLIKQVEKKLQETQSLIENYEKQLASHKNKLQPFIKKLQEIKENMKLNKNHALKGEINTK